MKLLVDMNLSPLWVEFFAASGIESIHWSTVGDPAAPDGAIMDYAAANGFIIFTHDLDFGRSACAPKSRQPSVIQIRTQDVLPTAVGLLIVRALRASRAQMEEAALVTVDLGRSPLGWLYESGST